MFKLSSAQSLWLRASQTAKRFPLQFLTTIISISILWLMIDAGDRQSVYQMKLCRILYSCNFALTLLLATDLFCGAKKYATIKKWGLSIAIVLICAGLYLSLNPWLYNADLYRVFLLSVSFHLLVSFAPYLGKGNLNGFWQFNKNLFLRFLTAIFYSGVLFAGLAIALVAIDSLFNVKIDYKIYLKLLSIVGVGFNTIFFLAGIPVNYHQLDGDKTYPKGLKIFTQYVLIPLMTIYLAILLIYEVKISIEWQLPKGTVSTLILGYAVFGILSLLLIYPIKEAEGNGWIRLFSRFFYLTMLPLIILLILAIIKRVGNYGITEPRYILIILAIWLSFISLYFLFSKQQNIKIIPISLAILALLASYGPQSAFSISKASQISRLAKLMKSNHTKEKNESAAVVRYLVRNHGLTALQPFTKTNLENIEIKLNQKSTKNNNWETKQNKVDTALAILNVKDETIYTTSNYINFKKDNRDLIIVKGFDAIYNLNSYANQNHLLIIDQQEISIQQKLNKKSYVNEIKIIVGKDAPLIINLNKIASQLIAKKNTFITTNDQLFTVPSSQMQMVLEHKGYTFKLILTDLNGNLTKGKFDQLNIEGYLLLKKK
jgi:hypothetical protein